MTTNLSGSLSEFSLAEVLALLGMGGRTARMQVTSSDAMGTVHLMDGRISSATADSSRAGLLRGVVAALPVPADDLAQALQAQDPVRALVESGVVDRDAAEQVASDYCIEAVGEMLDWTSGEFAVWVGSQDPGDIGVRLDVDELVSAARERAQQWHDLRAALPESDSVLSLVPGVAQAPVVDVDDWAVLARVDGRRTLAEVLAAMGASPLAAGDRLVQLMGRGLVAVRVGGSDAEQDRTNQLLDALDAGDAADEVVAVESAVGPEVEPTVEPEYVPDVHDLFVTEPQAVEEWQGAAAESWASSELEPVVGFDSESVPDLVAVPAEEFAATNEWAALVAPEFPAGPEPVLSQSLPAAVEPTPFELEPVTFELEPVTFELEPAGVDIEPVGVDIEMQSFEQDAAPVAFDMEAVVEPVGEPFAWSPWAQEMGLGEAPAVAPAEPESFAGSGFAEMVEDAGGHGHTEAFPVPQAPVAVVEEGVAPVEFAPVEYAPSDYAPVELEAAAQYVPQPRDPSDGVVDPSAYAQAVGSHAAVAEHTQVHEAAGIQAEAVDAATENAPDPLAGGLLAHLMSSVRGL